MPPRDEVLAFDVNETLLDLRALDAPFNAVFGDASLRPVWFQTMLQLSFVGGLTSEYVDFTQAQTAALQMLAQRAARPWPRLTTTPSSAACCAPAAAPRRLSESAQASRRYRQVTLTNSPLDVALTS